MDGRTETRKSAPMIAPESRPHGHGHMDGRKTRKSAPGIGPGCRGRPRRVLASRFGRRQAAEQPERAV